jgi:MtaA/CmuA family methyltransferase
MTNKEILFEALNFKEPNRVPWIPYVGVHGAYLIGKEADEYLQSVDLICQGFTKAREEYNPDALPIIFDLQLEAEAIGCKLMWAKDNPPAVTGHILDEVPLKDLKIPTEKDGRIPVVLEATEKIMAKFKDDIGVMGLVCGPFTLGLHLMGSKLITQMIRNPQEVLEVMEFCAEVCKEMTRLYLEKGVEIIAIVDPMTSQISPKFFDKFAAPYYKSTVDLVAKNNGHSLIFVCGNSTRITANLLEVQGATGVAVDEQIDMKFMGEESRKRKKVFAGNLPLTAGLLFGEVEDNIAFAEKLIETCKGPGFILATGCDMPYRSDPENVKAITKVVHGI